MYTTSMTMISQLMMLKSLSSFFQIFAIMTPKTRSLKTK